MDSAPRSFDAGSLGALIDAPRYPLLHGPTRLQRMTGLEAKTRRRGLYVKRDDEMGIAIGGNKLRSLEFWLGEALARSADVVVVAGGASSNQCRLAAAAAAIAGLQCIVCHNAPDDPSTRRDSFLNRLYGAEIRFLGSVDEGERARQAEQLAQDLSAAGRRPYIIGNAAVGALGYVRAAQELLDQSRAMNAGVRHVFLPGSMGPTEAGFIFGNILLGAPFEIHLVSVEYGRAELEARIQRILAEMRLAFRPAHFDEAKSIIHYHMDYLGDGYGKPTPRSEKAIVEIARCEGFLLEHVYTAKTFAAFIDAVSVRLPSDESACVIHTGGVPALFSQFDWFSDSL